MLSTTNCVRYKHSRPARVWELTFTTHAQNVVRFNMVARERRFTDSEKKDIVDDIICNEEMVSADGLEEELIIVKLRPKAISNKDKLSW